MKWLEVLKQMRGCYACKQPFYLLQEPALLPCHHELCCKTCFRQLQEAVCETCQATFQALDQDFFVKELLERAKTLYYDRTTNDAEKESNASVMANELNVLMERHSKSGDQSHRQVVAIAVYPDSREVQQTPLPDIYDLPYRPLNGEVFTVPWTCLVCGKEGNGGKRCTGCSRVNFHACEPNPSPTPGYAHYGNSTAVPPVPKRDSQAAPTLGRSKCSSCLVC